MLTMNGFTFSQAESLSDEIRIGLCIALGELMGRGKFNFHTKCFEEVK